MLATHTYGHPDITSLYAGDFSCQHVNWGYSTTSPDGEKPASWATVNNRASARPLREDPFLLSLMERRHLPGPGHCECRQWQLTAWQTSSMKVSAVTTSTPPNRSSKFLPTAIRWNVGIFARMVGRVFAFLHENPLTDCHLRTQQTSRRHTRNYVRAYYMRLNNVSPLGVARIMCHVGTKSAGPFITPSSDPSWHCLWQSRLVSIFTARRYEAGGMGRRCQFHRVLALQPEGVEHNHQTLKINFYPHWNI